MVNTMPLSNIVVVVTRKLFECDRVSAVIGVSESTASTLDDVEHYLDEKAKQHIEQFKSQFVEFKQADWSYSIMRIEQ